MKQENPCIRMLSLSRRCADCNNTVDGNGHYEPKSKILRCYQCCPCRRRPKLIEAEWNGRRFRVAKIDAFGVAIIAPGAEPVR
jgi:hypothetical protein